MELRLFCLVSTVVVLQIGYIDCNCTLPTLFDGIFWDSRTTQVTITRSTNSLSGWSVTTYSNTFSTYTCVQNDTKLWLFQSTNTANVLGDLYIGFFCVRLKQVTDYSYYYYLDSNIEPDAQSFRISIVPKVDIDTNGAVISTICSATTGPGTEEFHVLVKQNQQASVKQWLPDLLLGAYAYNVTDKSNVKSCGPSSFWDGCTNRTTIAFNYTQCTKQMFGSTSGVLYSTTYVTNGSTTFVSLINSDSSTSTRFTCLAVSGTSVSSNPGSCAMGQTATSATASSSSLLIKLTAYETCPFTTPSSDSNLGVIAGAAGGFGLILIVLCVVLVVLFKKGKLRCCKSKVSDARKVNAFESEQKKAPEETLTPRNEKFVAVSSLQLESFLGMVVESVSPRMAVDIAVVDEKKNKLPPLTKPVPAINVTKNQPLPSITRQ